MSNSFNDDKHGRVSCLTVLTDMEAIVVSAETVDDGLFRGRLVFDYPVRLAILGNRLSRWRTCDLLRELFTSSFCTDVE